MATSSLATNSISTPTSSNSNTSYIPSWFSTSFQSQLHLQRAPPDSSAQTQSSQMDGEKADKHERIPQKDSRSPIGIHKQSFPQGGWSEAEPHPAEHQVPNMTSTSPSEPAPPRTIRKKKSSFDLRDVFQLGEGSGGLSPAEDQDQRQSSGHGQMREGSADQREGRKRRMSSPADMRR